MREPVGVVAAIIPWNAPIQLITYKIAPALLAGCTVILKSAPEAPGEALIIAGIADSGLPPGVLNVVTADREVSELLVRDSRGRKLHLQGQLQRAAGSPHFVASGSLAALWSLEVSQQHWSLTTRTWTWQPQRWRGRSVCSRDRCVPHLPELSSHDTARINSLIDWRPHFLKLR